MQASQYLRDDTTAAHAAIALRRAVAQVAQERDSPWDTTVGKRVATAVSRAPEALQHAALSGCPTLLLATAPMEVLQPALAARCALDGDATDGMRLMTLDLPAWLFEPGPAAARFAAAFASLPQVERFTIHKLGVAFVDDNRLDSVNLVPPCMPPLAAALATLPDLVALRLIDSQLNRKMLTVLTAALPCHLRAFDGVTLDLLHVPGGVIGAQLASFTGMAHVHIGPGERMSDCDLFQLAKLSNLQRLDLVNCPLVTDRGVSHLAESPCAASLTRLTIQARPLSLSWSLASVAKHATLRHLALDVSSTSAATLRRSHRRCASCRSVTAVSTTWGWRLSQP
jgi:hypothetical protein